MVIRRTTAQPWVRFDGQLDQIMGEDEVTTAVDSGSPVKSGLKRPATPPTSVPTNKRLRSSPDAESSTHTTICAAPSQNSIAGQIFTAANKKVDLAERLGTGDIFLTEGFRERWCRCSSVSLISYY